MKVGLQHQVRFKLEIKLNQPLSKSKIFDSLKNQMYLNGRME